MPAHLQSSYYSTEGLLAAFPEFRDFRIIAESEKGGVFDVLSVNRGFRVALKLSADRGQLGARQRFDQEFEILFANQHCNRLLRIYGDHGYRSVCMLNQNIVQHFFFTMKLCRTDVGKAVRSNSMDLCSRIIAILQMLDGLSFLHSKFISHRDIKPGNLFLETITPEEAEFSAHSVSVKLGDFDIAKTSCHMPINQTRHPIGTLYYMAPERFTDDAPIDTDWRPSDQYAAGVSAFQILSNGALPLDFQNLENAGTVSPYGSVHLRGNRQPLTIPEKLPRTGPQRLSRIERVLYRMMAPEPSARFENILKCKLALLDALAASCLWPCKHTLSAQPDRGY